MSHELIGLLGLSATLLGVLVTSTWRLSALSSKLLAAVEAQKADSAEVKRELQALKTIPQLEIRIGHLEANHSLIPKIESRVVAVEAAQKFSKEWRRFNNHGRGSRPDTDGDDE